MSKMTRDEKLQLIKGIWAGAHPLSILIPDRAVTYVSDDGTEFFSEGKPITQAEYDRIAGLTDLSGPIEVKYTSEADGREEARKMSISKRSEIR